MIILWRCSILWWRKKEGWRFKPGDGRELFPDESTVAFSFDLTWLILVVGTPHHEQKAEF